jgi:hypothetical protein
MGRILMTGGGGGADLDVITAEADDILSGKVIVDKDGNPLTGTLTLSGDAGAGDVLSGKTFYTTNPKSKQTGTMGTMGGGTYTPKAAQQTVSCSGKKMTGNIVIKGDGNLTGNNILYGKSIFGVSGNVRKYAVWTGNVNTSGSGTFTYVMNNGSTYLPYLKITGFGFTPLSVTAYAYLSKGVSFTGYDGYNYFVYGNMGYQPNTGPARYGYNNIVMPVRQDGSHSVRIVGYY